VSVEIPGGRGVEGETYRHQLVIELLIVNSCLDQRSLARWLLGRSKNLSATPPLTGRPVDVCVGYSDCSTVNWPLMRGSAS